MVYRFIDENRAEFGLRWLCGRIGISLNAYYNYRKNRKAKKIAKKKEILEKIKYIYYNNNRVVGHRPMLIFLKRYGYNISKTTVHKYMNKDLGLSSIIMRKKPRYIKGSSHKIFNNLIDRDFNVDRKNMAWCTDFTYMRDPNGKFRYNCAIIDLYDRSVIASKNSSYIDSNLAIQTLKMALEKEKHPKDVILHSDQGSQYTSWEFVDFCKNNKVKQSMSKSGCPYDNAPMERYYNTFKSSFYKIYKFDSIEAMDKATENYVNYYNYVRPHSYNDYMTPMEKRYK